MPHAEEWDWPPPRTRAVAADPPRHAEWRPGARYKRFADWFFAAIIGGFRIALASALGAAVVGSLWLVWAILAA